ncbi:MAG: transcriptional repressor [Fibrobacterales bacterium]
MVVSRINTRDQLIKHGIRPSHQRIKIYDYLVQKRNHPSVDEIFVDLRSEIPTLSKTTIYNTLKEFHKHRLVTQLTIDENEMRYDSDTHIHGHFICENCNKIYDFEVDQAMLSSSLLDIVEVKEHHLYLKGICKNHNAADHLSHSLQRETAQF